MSARCIRHGVLVVRRNDLSVHLVPLSEDQAKRQPPRHMTTERNRYGLSRSDLKEETKRALRQAAGFGCVCCGIAIATYEHIEPEFKDATRHDPDAMAYLCAGCHSKVTRGTWSKDKVWRAKKDPWCLTHGRPHDDFDISPSGASIWLGPNRIINVSTILSIDDEPILEIEPPEERGAPFRISARFYDRNDNLIFTIVRNEWHGEPSAWDINSVGPRTTIRTGPRSIALQFRAAPPEGIVIERAHFSHRGTELSATSRRVRFTGRNKSAFILKCKLIISTLPNATFLFTEGDGVVMGAMPGRPGPLVLNPSVEELFPKKIMKGDPCLCGSGREYGRCHGDPTYLSRRAKRSR
jgi:hypothetical protein